MWWNTTDPRLVVMSESDSRAWLVLTWQTGWVSVDCSVRMLVSGIILERLKVCCVKVKLEKEKTEEMKGMRSLLYLLKLNSHFVDGLEPAHSGRWERQGWSIIQQTEDTIFRVVILRNLQLSTISKKEFLTFMKIIEFNVAHGCSIEASKHNIHSFIWFIQRK